MSDRPRLLVVDDDARLAASLRRTLAYAGYEVEVAGDGLAALEAAGRHEPDLVVLDVMLPGIDGFEVCRRLRAASDDVPILMLTARDAVPDRVRGLEGGADDYLVKPFAPSELVARVRALLRRREPGRREVLRFADVTMDVDAYEVRRAERTVELTALEFSLLEHLLRHPRAVQGRDRLLDAVWGIDDEAGSNVVDVYVGYLRGKLEADGEPRLIQTVRGVGYVLREA